MTSNKDRVNLSWGDGVNLYATFLGRMPENDEVVRQLEGREQDDGIRAFVHSSEFETQVLEPVAGRAEWPAGLYRRAVGADIVRWLGDFFPDHGAFRDPEAIFTWPSILLALFSSGSFAEDYLPAHLVPRRDAFRDGLAQVVQSIVDDAVLVAASAFFDADHYAQHAKRAFCSATDAALHFVTIGSRRGLRPSKVFDPAYYFEMNQDVAASGAEALTHFLRYGRAEKRRYRLSRAPFADLPDAPPPAAWLDLAGDPHLRANCESAKTDAESVVDIIIPVYRGLSDTLACIFSVLMSRNRTPYRLIVLDDRSPEPELSDALDRLAEQGLIVLLRNPVNLGFVGTVNRGMALSDRRDVILLNSDTEVYGDWIDRLRAQAYSTDRVATVTPFSNNATIFSYPFYVRSNNHELELPFAELDAVMADANRGRNITVPTGVGFCFYIRRAALDEIGLFDETLFGKGYGEENDFCMRAIEHAWDNIAALDIFVRHTGEVSFAEDASAGKQAGYRRLITAHPRYDAMIGRFVARDPFRPARSTVDVARFARMSEGRGVLMIEHGWGGGIERHINDLVGLLATDGVHALVWRPERDGVRGRLHHPLSDEFPNLPEFSWSDVPRAAAILRALNVRHVHIHSLVGIPDHEVRGMLAAIAMAGLPYDFTVHDYAVLCPRITMIDWAGSYCETPSPAYCRECIARGGTAFGVVDVDEWRARYQGVIQDARTVFVPDPDVAQRLSRYMDVGGRVIVRPHPRTTPPRVIPHRQPGTAGVRRIGIIGAIGEHKGARLLRMLCADALDRQLPLQFILYGYTDRGADEDVPNLRITGQYDEEELPVLLDKEPCDIALYLSVWPETFSYTLDHAFENGIYPVAFDFGAIARRIRQAGFGTTLPLSHLYNPALLNDFLLKITPETIDRPVDEEGRRWVSVENYYGEDVMEMPDRR